MTELTTSPEQAVPERPAKAGRATAGLIETLRDAYLRIDARSLGLFRIAMGLVLIGDLVRRWRWVKEFYSNEGVLPNHNHIFVLNQKAPARVWSVLHSFSTPWENHFAFAVILVVYVLFLVGHRTRFFHVLSVVMLVSLTGRNILLENAGSYAAIGLLVFTSLLPCGSRFSIDSIRRRMEARDEKNGAELNAAREPDDDEIEATRAPGWSPVSLAALAVLGQVVVIYAATAIQQTGSWRDGSALYYAINVERWVSNVGIAARGLPPSVLAAWSLGLYYAGWAIPILLIAPAPLRVSRGLAIALMLVHAVTLGVLFHFGLYAWTLGAAAALFVPRATWERAARPRPAAFRTLIYDADCGVCLWIARVLRRLDAHGHLAFQGNDQLDALAVRTAEPPRGHGPYRTKLQTSEMPEGVTQDLVDRTVVVVTASGEVATRGRAVAAVLEVLPFGRAYAWILRLPGISQLLDVAYDLFAARRQRVSVAMGKEACGIDAHHEAQNPDPEPAAASEVAPATRLVRLTSGSLRDAAAAAIFVALLAQTAKENDLGRSLPQSEVLAAIAEWPRMIGKWDVMTPEPPRVDGLVIIDAQTRGGDAIDTLTGEEPSFVPLDNHVHLGQLWTDYFVHVREPRFSEFQRALRDYLNKGGPRWDSPVGPDQLAGYDGYWIEQPIPPPGQPRDPAAVRREKMFTFSRGGRASPQPTRPHIGPPVKR